MQRIPLEPGRVVRSLAGRDEGRYFVVLQLVEDDQFVLLADGDTRKYQHPKKKKIKHVKPCPHRMEGVSRLLETQQLQDAHLRKALAGFDLQRKPLGKEGSDCLSPT